MLIDITEEIVEGKYDYPKLSFFGHKLFGRRVFVKIEGMILLGHLQYTIDTEESVVIIYINFEYRRNISLRHNGVNLKIKEYGFEQGMDLDRYLKEIRKEIINNGPQNKDYTWSFKAKDLL